MGSGCCWAGSPPPPARSRDGSCPGGQRGWGQLVPKLSSPQGFLAPLSPPPAPRAPEKVHPRKPLPFLSSLLSHAGRRWRGKAFESGWKSVCEPSALLTEPPAAELCSPHEPTPMAQRLASPPWPPGPPEPPLPSIPSPHSPCISSLQLPRRRIPLLALPHPFSFAVCMSSPLHAGASPLPAALQRL